MHVYPTPAELSQWIASSHKGDRFQYHLGHLVHDRAFRVTLAASLGFTVVRVKPLDDIANAALEAYKQGYITLAQERVGEDLFRYLAIRTRKYHKAPLVQPKELQNAN